MYGAGATMMTPHVPTTAHGSAGTSGAPTATSAPATASDVDKSNAATSGQPHPTPPVYHQQQYAPPPPPGMAMPYNPYNYGNYYQQNYGYYQNPQVSVACRETNRTNAKETRSMPDMVPVSSILHRVETCHTIIQSTY